MRMLTGARNGRGGLTLIEVLVAITILGVVSAAVVSSFGTLATLSRTGQLDAALVSDSRTSIEDIRAWASDPTVFNGLSVTTVDERLGDLTVEADCLTNSVVSVGTDVARLAITCSLQGAASPARFDFDLARPVTP